VLSYERAGSEQRLLVALNFDSEPKKLQLPSWAGNRVLLSTTAKPRSVSDPFVVYPDEGVIVGMQSA
jgi:hypothetical protein